MNHHPFCHTVHHNQDKWIVMMEDLINIINQIYPILSIIVEPEPRNVWSPNVIVCRFGRSNHYNVYYQFNTANHKGTFMEIK